MYIQNSVHVTLLACVEIWQFYAALLLVYFFADTVYTVCIMERKRQQTAIKEVQYSLHYTTLDEKQEAFESSRAL